LDLIDAIEENYMELTNKQKAIADYMLANPESICYISLKQLSLRTKSSEVTILRMCKRMGFNSFLDLKKAFREHTKQVIRNLKGTDLIVPDISLSHPGNKIHLLRRISDKEYESSKAFYKGLDYQMVLAAADSILSADEVLIFGNEISAMLGEFLYRRLVMLGIHVTMIHPEDMDHVRAGLSRLKPKDQIIAITFPQYYLPLRNIVRYAEEKGAAVIAITDSPESPAVTDRSLNFLCPSSTKLFYNSPTLPIAIINLISSGIIIQMGPRYEQMLEETRNIVHYIDQQDSK
jgi:DNA-binding MurR/RpiR family transcriptional regulator